VGFGTNRRKAWGGGLSLALKILTRPPQTIRTSARPSIYYLHIYLIQITGLYTLLIKKKHHVTDPPS